MQRDPVCGSEVDPTQALRTTYHGQPYSFCSLRCKQAFEDAPLMYAGQTPQPNRSEKALDAVIQTWTMAEATDATTRLL